jgi:hypothetical protein
MKSSSIHPWGRARLGARPHHVFERAVDRDGELTSRAPQRPALAERVKRNDRARVGRPPRDRAAALDSHREKRAAVGSEQRARLEVGADAGDIGLVGGLGRREQTRTSAAARSARQASASRLRAVRPTLGVVGAGVHLEHLGVTRELLDLVLGHVAVASEPLDGPPAR